MRKQVGLQGEKVQAIKELSSFFNAVRQAVFHFKPNGFDSRKAKEHYMKYSFKFKLFGSKVQMYNEGEMGIVIEKEPQVVCIYGTDNKHQNILCAIPLCSPKLLKGAEYTVEFCENNISKISVSDIQVVIDFENKKCANNKNIKCYGSNSWGQNVQIQWNI